MAFNELLSSSFLFSIAIIIILIGGVFAYVSYRMSEQDHKMASMLGLISTMAQELQFFRSNLSQPELTKPEEPRDMRTHIILDPNNLVVGQPTLISVSDDEDETNDDEVSDDEETDDETNDEETDNEETDNEETDDEVSDDEDKDKVFDLEEHNLNNNANLNGSHNIKSIHLEELIDLNLDQEPEEPLLDHSDGPLLDLQTISISDLEEVDKKPDYKKMSLSKLQEDIVETGIVADASKLKKNDILKLLGVE